MAEHDLTAERLRQLLSYNQDNGLFTWLKRDEHEFISTRSYKSWTARYAGKSAGHKRRDTGYVIVVINGTQHKGHRLAWLYVYGRWPEHGIDHINGDRSDNRIQNLRDVPPRTNSENQRSAKSGNKAGMLGVSWHEKNKKWQAEICIDGKKHYIGTFKKQEDAHKEYISVKRAMHGGCTI